MNIGIGIGLNLWRRNGAAGAASNDWWLSGDINPANAIAVYQPIGAADLATSYVNLANPGTNNATVVVAPTWAAETGWTFNGTTQALTTGLACADGWSMFVRFSNCSATSYMCGSGTAGSSFYLRPNNGGTLRTYGYGTTKSITGVLTEGVMGVAGPTAYLNGATDGASAGAIGGTISGVVDNIALGARRSTSSYNNFFPGNIQAVAIYDATLTADQVAALSTAMAALS